MAKQQCAEQIYGGIMGGNRCVNTGKVEDSGKWWCGIHSPEAKQKRKAKRDARHAKWTAEFEAGIKRREEAQSQRDALAESHAALVEVLEERDKTIKLCRSYASNTGGGLDAEARLRRIFELCCHAPEAPP